MLGNGVNPHHSLWRRTFPLLYPCACIPNYYLTRDFTPDVSSAIGKLVCCGGQVSQKINSFVAPSAGVINVWPSGCEKAFELLWFIHKSFIYNDSCFLCLLICIQTRSNTLATKPSTLSHFTLFSFLLSPSLILYNYVLSWPPPGEVDLSGAGRLHYWALCTTEGSVMHG